MMARRYLWRSDPSQGMNGYENQRDESEQRYNMLGDRCLLEFQIEVVGCFVCLSHTPVCAVW